MSDTTDKDAITRCGWCGGSLQQRFAASPTRLLVTLGPATPRDRVRVQYCELCWDVHAARSVPSEKGHQKITTDDEASSTCGWCGGSITCKNPAGTSLEIVFEDHEPSTTSRYETQYCRLCRDRHVRCAREYAEPEEFDSEDPGGESA